MVQKKILPRNGKFGLVENYIKNIVIDSEYFTARSNNQEQYADYESILDMVELVRSEKHYDWHSDIFIGLLLSHMLTEAASWAAQDFQSRDFCDIYLEGNHPDDKKKAQAAKTIINSLLNIKDVYHFQKRIRARTINWIFGQVYTVMWWEKEKITKTVQPPPKIIVVNDYDENGNMVPKTIETESEPIKIEETIIDRVNYDVFDARNVFTDFSYTYSAQQKPWITLRSEVAWSKIKSSEKSMQYFNLDIIEGKILGTGKEKKVKSSIETTTSKESYNKLGGAYGSKTDFFKKIDPTLDILDRYGTIWAIVKERDEDGLPVIIEPGYDDFGAMDDKGELVESIVTFAGIGEEYTMIGFRPTWAIDAKGKPYKPIIRGWCYVHPTKDIGLSDGKNIREMNIAANDTFNISNDRVMLATLPTLVGRRDAVDNNPTVFIEPTNVILLENPMTDLREMKISDNIGGALTQMGFIKATASEMDAIWPTTMGGLPEKTSTTATAVQGAENRTSARGNLKGMTWTWTYDIEYYQMILQLAYRFADNDTIVKILGEELYQYFDPNSDYTYVPLSASLEQEHSKMRKVQTWDQIMGRMSVLLKYIPKETIPLLTHIFVEECKLMGSEFREFGERVEKLLMAKVQEEGKSTESIGDSEGTPTSNQNGVEMQSGEMGVRSVNQGGT